MKAPDVNIVSVEEQLPPLGTKELVEKPSKSGGSGESA